MKCIVYKKIRTALRQYGAAGFVCWLTEKAPRLLGIRYERYRLWTKNLSAETAASGAGLQRLTFADLLRQREHNPEWFTTRRLNHMYAALQREGSEAWGCYDGALLMAYGFLDTRYWGAATDVLPSTYGYLWEAYTHPAYRGRGWHGRLSRWRCHRLRVLGCERVVTIVADFNRASDIAFRRDGFRPAARFAVYHYPRGKWHSTFEQAVAKMTT